MRLSVGRTVLCTCVYVLCHVALRTKKITICPRTSTRPCESNHQKKSHTVDVFVLILMPTYGKRLNNFTFLDEGWLEWKLLLKTYIAEMSSTMGHDINTAASLKTPITCHGVNRTTLTNSRQEKLTELWLKTRLKAQAQASLESLNCMCA